MAAAKKATPRELAAEAVARTAAAAALGVPEKALRVMVRIRQPKGIPRRISDDLIQAAVISEGGFLQAARALGCSATLIRRRIKQKNEVSCF